MLRTTFRQLSKLTLTAKPAQKPVKRCLSCYTHLENEQVLCKACQHSLITGEYESSELKEK